MRSKQYGKVKELEKTWLNIREASAYLGLSSWTLRRYKDSGMMPFYKVGGTILFAKHDLDRLVEKNKVV